MEEKSYGMNDKDKIYDIAIVQEIQEEYILTKGKKQKSICKE